jgi:phage shock protein A
MARQKLAEERVANLRQQIGEYEQYALKALDADNPGLAREVAEKIARLENDLAGERLQGEEFAASATRLRAAIGQAEGNIKQLKQQIDTVKATESVQKAQQAVAQRHGDAQSRLHSAVESLERIKQKQAERAALMDASAELAAEGNGDQALERKLHAAGLVASGSSAEQVLARLQARQAD